jgi:thioester reductase-like protein
MDSSKAVALASALRRISRTPIPVVALFRHPTIRAIVQHLSGAAVDRTEEPSRLRSDGDMPLSIRISDREIAASQWTSPKALLITGATGFVGGCLAEEISRRTSAKLYCLVRDETKLAPIPRAVAIRGDIAEERLGLASSVYEQLAREVDGIVHCAAHVNWALPYPQLFAPNVMGTKHALELASAGKLKTFHLISTSGVAFGLGTTLEEYGSDPSRLLELRGPAGYYQSKWVAERLVSRAEELGVPTTCIRLPYVGAHSKSGKCNLADFVPRLIAGCLGSKTAPDWDGTFNVVPVDHTASAIAAIVLRAESKGRIFHLQHPEPMRWAAFFDLLSQHAPGMIRQTDWVERLSSHPDDHPLYPLQEILHDVESTWFSGTSVLDTANASDALRSAGVRFPPIHGELVHAWIAYIEASLPH